ANTEARARVTIDGGGRDVTGRPNPPQAVCLAPAPGGGCRVSWVFQPDQRCGAPEGFRVYLAGGPIAPGADPGAPGALPPGRVGFGCALPGPFDLGTYTAAVEAYNEAGSGQGAAAAATIGLPATPLLMEAVTARVLGFTNTTA